MPIMREISLHVGRSRGPFALRGDRKLMQDRDLTNDASDLQHAFFIHWQRCLTVTCVFKGNRFGAHVGTARR